MEKTIEITTKIGCSLFCEFCPQKKLINEYKKKSDEFTMTFDTFKTCIDKIPKNIVIDFSGMCEPWLNKECTKMMKYAVDSGHQINIYTTLVGVNIDDYTAIKETNYKTLVLHIPDEEENSHFNLSESYLSILKTALNDIIAGELRVNNFSCHGKVHPLIKDLVEMSGVKVMSEMYDRAGNVDSNKVQGVEKEKKGRLICTYCGGDTLNRNVLLPNGIVLMCCMDYGMEFVLGNLLDGSYDEICRGINKSKYRKKMKSIQNGDILCRHCHVSENYYKYMLKKCVRFFGIK